jgi:nicotinate-nucleotide--dimethylbenzimidazole phosphoribosyltransferase
MTVEQALSVSGILGEIEPCDRRYAAAAQAQLNSLTKPIGSLGQLENSAAQLFSIFRGEIPKPLHRAVYVFAADHGVVAEGVSAYPRQVTAQMVRNFLSGGAAINVLARLHQADLTVVDVGVDAEFDDVPRLVRMKVSPGSRNMKQEAAMTREELSAALRVGIDLAHASKARGEHLVAIGEMGIGNTTAASAVTAMLTQRSVPEVTGRGTGLDSEGRDRKLNVIRRSLRLHFGNEKSAEPLEVLRCVGGLELAAITGFVLGAAANRVAIICDGFISTAAAAVACAIAPHVTDYLFAGHCSEEPGHRFLLRFIGIRPILNLGMRLGEGTGAVLAMPVIESAVYLFNEMATFSSAEVSGRNS